MLYQCFTIEREKDRWIVLLPFTMVYPQKMCRSNCLEVFLRAGRWILTLKEDWLNSWLDNVEGISSSLWFLDISKPQTKKINTFKHIVIRRGVPFTWGNFAAAAPLTAAFVRRRCRTACCFFVAEATSLSGGRLGNWVLLESSGWEEPSCMCIESDWQWMVLKDLGLIKHSGEKRWNRILPVPSPMLAVCWRKRWTRHHKWSACGVGWFGKTCDLRPLLPPHHF